MKPVNWISATGRKPCAASPTDTPGDSRFGERRVEDAIRAEAVEQPVGRAEHAAVGTDILADDEHRGVVGHRSGERQVDGLNECDLGHRASLSRRVERRSARCSARSVGSRRR